jgi:hypothetical protein
MCHLPVFHQGRAEIVVEALSAMGCQRDQALPTALAPKISLDRECGVHITDRPPPKSPRARWILGRKRQKRPLVSGPRKEKQCNQISQYSASTLQRPAACEG